MKTVWQIHIKFWSLVYLTRQKKQCYYKLDHNANDQDQDPASQNHIDNVRFKWNWKFYDVSKYLIFDFSIKYNDLLKYVGFVENHNSVCKAL